MLAVLQKVVHGGTSEAVCCWLAYHTTSRAFELLCARCEDKGLVYVNSKLAAHEAVFCDRDPSWQEAVSGGLAQEVTGQLTLTGKGCWACNGSYHKLLLLQLTESGGKAYKLLACAPSPRVKLPFRNKEPDFAWAPRDRADMAGNPTVVLEVAVFNESEEELLAEGSDVADLT